MTRVTQEGMENEALMELSDFQAGALPELQPPINSVIHLLIEMTEPTQELPGLDVINALGAPTANANSDANTLADTQVAP